MLVFEDLHWIDSETQAFLDSLVDSLPASRILLAVNYRPEYRHGWATRRLLPPDSHRPVGAGERGSTARSAASAPTGHRIAEKAPDRAAPAGSPLFLEESVRTLVETGALVGERGAYRLCRRPIRCKFRRRSGHHRVAHRPARSAGQTAAAGGAVVGTHVPFELLARQSSDIDDDALKRSLAKLQTAEFIYEAQLFPDLEYAFKHALTHEVAYGKRVCRTGGARCMRRSSTPSSGFTPAGCRSRSSDSRIMQRKAGFRSRRSAICAKPAKSGGRLGEAAPRLAYFDELPSRFSANFRAIHGNAHRSTRNPHRAWSGADQYERAHLHRSRACVSKRARTGRRAGARRAAVYRAVESVCPDYTRATTEPALQSGDRLLDTARKGNDSGQLLEAHHSAWPTLFAMGRVKDAFPHMEAGCALYDPQRHAKHAFLYAGHDPGVCARYHLGVTRWLLGYPDQALADVEQALAAARNTRPPDDDRDHTVVCQLAQALARRPLTGALANLQRMVDLGTQHEFMPWTITAQAFFEVLRQPRTDAKQFATFSNLSRRPSTSRAGAARFFCARWRNCRGNSGHADAGLCVLSAMDAKGRDSLGATEMLRLEGELLALKSAAPADEITACFKAAI